MKKDKLRSLFMSSDEELVNLGILMGKDALSDDEKISAFLYIAKKFPTLSISPDGFISNPDNTITVLSNIALEYKDVIMPFKITKDGTKKFDRSANRVRRPRKPRTGTDTLKSS